VGTSGLRSRNYIAGRYADTAKWIDENPYSGGDVTDEEPLSPAPTRRITAQ
jgi:hypothetical protein